jgi:hypothetical protein
MYMIKIIAAVALTAAATLSTTSSATESRPVIAQCVETVRHGDAYLNHCSTGTTNHAAVVCARAAFLADDFAHTHTGARHERRAVRRCAALVGGF